jgi:hypothetical protein
VVYVEIKNMAQKYAAWRRKQLEKQKQVGKNPDNSPSSIKIPTWKEWKRKAGKAAKELTEDIRKGNPINFKVVVWKTLKHFLVYLFHGKCAYCEGRYRAGSPLDVEHYRPKAEVTLNRQRSSIVKIVNHNDDEVTHPGYYWLAYDPQNLLLACEICNREEKKNQFPIRGPRACCPDDSLDDELPLLLNPYRVKKLAGHFQVFDEKSGFLEGISEEGKRTIEVCGLHREDLVIARQEEWEKVKIELFRKFLNSRENTQLVPDQMQYSLYLKLALKTVVNKMAAGLDSQF